MDRVVDITVLLSSNLPGVYLLCWDDEVVYVGQSKNVLRRVMSHRTTPMKNKFNRVLFIRCELRRLETVEKQMINKYKPRLNVQHNPIDVFAELGVERPEPESVKYQAASGFKKRI